MSFDTDIDALYATYKRLLPMAQKDEDRLWQKFRLDWNYNSNRIEGNTLTYKETRELILGGLPPTKPRRHVKEMKAHDLAISIVLEMADNSSPITEVDIKQLNQVTLKEPFYHITRTDDGNESRVKIIPGKYKTQPNHVLQRSGEIHKFAEPIEVPVRMAACVSSINKYLKEQQEPLHVFLARFHHEFIQIHPFGDGNGRTCRLVMNFICKKLGWEPVIIKDAKKGEYYQALESADEGNMTALEFIMKSELEWSLKKAIAAANGEDIEDADDVDKEISNFVKENSQPFGTTIKTNENVKRIHLSYTIPIMEILETRIAQFERMFEVYNPPTKSDRFKKVINNNRILERSKWPFSYSLERYKSDIYSADIRTTIFVEFGSHNYKIECEIRSHNGQQSRFIEFSQTDYSSALVNDAVDDFCSKIGHAVLDVVKDYKLKATET